MDTNNTAAPLMNTYTSHLMPQFNRAMCSGMRRPILLHLDINRTLIQVDPAGGKSLQDMLNTNLAARILGNVYRCSQTESDRKGIKTLLFADEVLWKPLSHSEQSPTRAEALMKAARINSSANENMATREIEEDNKTYKYQSTKLYSEFVDEDLVPRPAEMDSVNSSLSVEARRQLWSEVTALRRKYKNTFTNVGHDGADFAEEYAALMKGMRCPAANVEVAVEEKQENGHIDGKFWYILPSFFSMVNTLSVMNWPFSVVFRTFGNDLDDVLHEWRSFLLRKHQHFTPIGPVLESVFTEWQQQADENEQWYHRGCVVREGEDVFHVCWHPEAVKPSPKKVHQFKAQVGDANGVTDYFLAQGWGPQVATETPQSLFQSLMLKAFPSLYTEKNVSSPHILRTLALQDDYDHWASAGEAACAGKVFVCNEQDRHGNGTPYPYQVFFDDNVYINDIESIVDLRIISNTTIKRHTADSPIPEKTQRKCLVQADPNQAILNHAYFVQELAQVLELQQEGLA